MQLSRNKILNISKELFSELRLLEDLDISQNGLLSIHEFAFKDLVKLKKLQLAENDIEKLHSGILFRVNLNVQLN